MKIQKVVNLVRSCAEGKCTPSENIDKVFNYLSGVFHFNSHSEQQCPKPKIDLNISSNFSLGVHELSYHCDLMEQSRDLVASLLRFIIALSFVIIVFSA